MALVGLLSVQYYQSRRMFLLNREFLTATVDAAMEDAVRAIDARLLASRQARVRNRLRVSEAIDSVSERLMRIRLEYPQVTGRPSGIVWEADGRYVLVEDRIQRMTWKDTVGGVVLSGSFLQADEPERPLPDTLRERIRLIYRTLSQEREDLMYAERLMDEMMRHSWREMPERELGLQLPPEEVDSIVSAHLSARNVRTAFEWGIYSEYSAKLLLQKTGNYGVRLLQSPFRYRLFPEQETDYPTYLFLYFPDRVSFIVSRMWYLTLSSVFLFALLIYTFLYTLVSIWKQKKLTEMKSDFINHVTHEIKTPVSTIALICESFDDPDVHYDQAGLKNVLDIIRHENQRLQSLSGQIIQISKLESGDYFLNRTRFEMCKAIEEAVNNTGFQVMHKNGRIHTSFDAENDWVVGDRTHIVHIISNLIDNANKYCQEKPLIEISTFNTPGGLQVDVKDNGIGIAKSNLKKIFDKLYRVPTGNKHDVKGFGLGLSYVASIMKQHGGKVWVESEQKEGSVFHLFFPQENKN